MLGHKELVEKIYQHSTLIKEAELVKKEIETYILRNTGLSVEAETEVWREIQLILSDKALSDDPDFAIAQLELILAKLRVKKMMAKKTKEQPENIIVMDSKESSVSGC